MQITFIGAGYVGLVSGIMFAHFGHDVICIDNDVQKIVKLNNSILPIYEENLEQYFNEAVSKNKISFYNSPVIAREQKRLWQSKTNNKEIDCRVGANVPPRNDKLGSEIIFITVGTPSLIDGSANLEYVEKAVLEVAKFANKNALIVIKSTVPPGTCNYLQQLLVNAGFEQEIASNPEFLREGSAAKDFLNPDRIIIGVLSERANKMLHKLYDSCRLGPVMSTNPATSEMIKYTSNSFLAVKIAFINEISNLCEKVDANIDDLSLGIGLDPRIGNEFLNVGPGFGGSCFPKDTLGLASLAKKHDTCLHVLDGAIKANKERPKDMVKKIMDIISSSLKENSTDKSSLRSSFGEYSNPKDNKKKIDFHIVPNGALLNDDKCTLNLKICILGLSFKAGTDDVRDSPAIEIVRMLLDENLNLVAYDPKADKNAKQIIPSLKLANSLEVAVKDAKIVIILTEWQEFKVLENIEVDAIIIDLRNLLDASTMKKQKFKYYSLGRQ